MMCSEKCHLERVPRDEYRLHREKETVSKPPRESYYSKQKFKDVEEYSFTIQSQRSKGGQNCRQLISNGFKPHSMIWDRVDFKHNLAKA